MSFTYSQESLIRRQFHGCDLLHLVGLLDELHPTRSLVDCLPLRLLLLRGGARPRSLLQVLFHVAQAQVPAHRVEQEQLRIRLVQKDQAVTQFVMGAREVSAKGVSMTLLTLKELT